MKPLIAVAVSGGVDSLMAAAILKTHGYPVFGIHFLTGYEPDNRNIAAVTDQLGIPLHVVDLTDAFRTQVIGYFLRTYMRGKTPNPCLVCNPVVKFGVLFEHASAWGLNAWQRDTMPASCRTPTGSRICSGVSIDKKTSLIFWPL